MSSTRRSRSRQSGSSCSRITDRDHQINDLVSKLQQLLPQIRPSQSDKVSGVKVLQDTCSYIRSLQSEVDDLSDKLSELLEMSDTTEVAIIRTLFMQLNNTILKM